MRIEDIKRRINNKKILIKKLFVLFIFGCLIAAISVSVFYNPNDVVTTGCTGLSIFN
ncbi:MAG: YitT family protein [Bacilli bacterium]|nr:MAG: YitT family protein [Bacilli bacterium]